MPHRASKQGAAPATHPSCRSPPRHQGTNTTRAPLAPVLVAPTDEGRLPSRRLRSSRRTARKRTSARRHVGPGEPDETARRPAACDADRARCLRSYASSGHLRWAATRSAETDAPTGITSGSVSGGRRRARRTRGRTRAPGGSRAPGRSRQDRQVDSSWWAGIMTAATTAARTLATTPSRIASSSAPAASAPATAAPTGYPR